MVFFYIVLLIGSAFLMAFSGSLLVESLIRLAEAVNWREFVVGFFIMALATSAPNLFVGITSALRGVPELSFGDVVGGNVVDLTLGLALGALIGGGILAESRTVQSSAIFTMAITILPLFLSLDGQLGRGDGLVLITMFFLYAFWLFSKEERFRKIYDGVERKGRKYILKSVFLLLLGISFLILGAQGVVKSAFFFADSLGLSIGIVGLLIVSLGDCLPEIYFTIVSARKNQDWLILGNMMGGVITCATLVLGTVVLIHPLQIVDFSPYILGRIFLIIATLSFLIFLRTGKKLSRKEGLFLLAIYIAFLLSEIFLRSRF